MCKAAGGLESKLLAGGGPESGASMSLAEPRPALRMQTAEECCNQRKHVCLRPWIPVPPGTRPSAAASAALRSAGRRPRRRGTPCRRGSAAAAPTAAASRLQGGPGAGVSRKSGELWRVVDPADLRGWAEPGARTCPFTAPGQLHRSQKARQLCGHVSQTQAWARAAAPRPAPTSLGEAVLHAGLERLAGGLLSRVGHLLPVGQGVQQRAQPLVARLAQLVRRKPVGELEDLNDLLHLGRGRGWQARAGLNT